MNWPEVGRWRRYSARHKYFCWLSLTAHRQFSRSITFNVCISTPYRLEHHAHKKPKDHRNHYCPHSTHSSHCHAIHQRGGLELVRFPDRSHSDLWSGSTDRSDRTQNERNEISTVVFRSGRTAIRSCLDGISGWYLRQPACWQLIKPF